MTRHSSFVIRHFPLALLALSLAACTSPVERYRDQGIALYNQGKFDQSQVALNKALSADEFDAKSNAYAGLIDYHQGKYEQAAYHFKVALQADPSSEEAKTGLTATLIKQGKPDMALDYLERAAAMADKVKDPYMERSDIRRRFLKQTDENLYRGRVGDRIRIGDAYELLGDYDNALLYYQKALILQPNNTRALMAIAKLYDITGDKPAARQYLAKTYRIDPSTPGLTEAMTRDDLPISDVLTVPAPKAPLIPAAKSPGQG